MMCLTFEESVLEVEGCLKDGRHGAVTDWHRKSRLAIGGRRKLQKRAALEFAAGALSQLLPKTYEAYNLTNHIKCVNSVGATTSVCPTSD